MRLTKGKEGKKEEDRKKGKEENSATYERKRAA